MLEAVVVDATLADPRVARLFDGVGFRECGGDGPLTVTPGLIDAGAGIGGYRERLTAPLLEAPRAILRLLEQWGVCGLRVSSSSWAELAHLRSLVLQAAGPPLWVTGGGPVLTDAEPDSDRQRWITTAGELERAVSVAAIEEVGWVSVQTDQMDFALASVSAAHQRGLRVALRAPAAMAISLRAGDIFVGVGNLVRRSNRDRALGVLLAWADATVTDTLDQAMELADRGVALTSELLSLHRNVFLRDALDAPFLEENVAILPHVRWVLQMRRGAGYISGRSALREHTGLAEPTRAESRAATEGWQRLLEAVGRMDGAGVRILPASTAPQMTLLPGFGLKEELGVWLQAGIPLARVLTAATGGHWLGLDASGPLLASSELPSSGARFLATLAPLR